MAKWLENKGRAGWTAVSVEADGLFGVTVLAPERSGGKPRVVKCGAMPGAQLDAEALTELSKKISVNGCPWTLPLSHKEYNILMVAEPSVQKEEMEQSVRWLIGSMIDYLPEEASVDWMKIPTAEWMPNRPSNIYVLSAKKEITAEIESFFHKAKVQVQALDVREAAQRNIAALAERQGEGVGMLYLGKQGVQFTITFNGALYLDRYIEESLFSGGLVDEIAKARACERIALQVQRSLDFIGRTLPFIEMGRVLVAPMPGNTGIGDTISQYLQMPVEKLDLASVFDFSQTPELAQEENQALYFSALGASLRFLNTSEQINLQGRKESRFSFTQVSLAGLGLFLLLLLGIWSMRQDGVAAAQKIEAASALQLREASAKLQERMKKSGEDLGARIAVLRPQAEAAQKILAQAGELGKPEGYAKYFSALAAIAEDGMWLTNVSIDKGGKSVIINGHALRDESVMRYTQRLNAIFADYGVQFSALELTNGAIGNPADPKSQITDVAFRLH